MRHWRRSAVNASIRQICHRARSLLVEPSEPFLGTTRLDKLPYHNVDLTQFYPYGSPAFSI
jgi:hypothetical protein